MRKILFSFVFVIVLCIPHKAEASLWGISDAITGAIQQVWQELRDIIFELAGAFMEVATTQTITTFILGNLGGNSNSAFIQDYRDYLFNEPAEAGSTYAEAFLTEVMHGRVPGDYGYGDGVDGLLGHYEARLRLSASRGFITGAQTDGIREFGVDIADYCTLRDGELLLFGEATQTSFTCFSRVFSNPYNHPSSLRTITSTAFDQAVEQDAKAKEVEGLTAQGALSEKDENGQVTNPALNVLNDLQSAKSTVYDKVVNIKIDHPVAQAVYSTAVPALLSATDKAIEREVNRAKKKAQEEIEEYRRQQFGESPGIQFQPNNQDQTDTGNQ